MSQERHIKILISSNKGHYKTLISMKIVIKNFCEKLREFSFKFLNKIYVIVDFCKIA